MVEKVFRNLNALGVILIIIYFSSATASRDKQILKCQSSASKKMTNNHKQQ